MKWAVLAVLVLGLACSPAGDGSDAAEGAAAAEPAGGTGRAAAVQRPGGEGAAAVRVDPDRLIRRDGIGHAAAGMTLGDLRAALPTGVSLGRARPYMVDIAAMPVVEEGDTLYAVLIPAGESSGDDAHVHLVATTDTSFRTMEGVGPGSTLAEAAAIYGAPTLGYSVNDESREYATFPALPTTIRFRVRPASDTAAFAGIYTTAGEYNETTRYDPAAVVWMVLVFTR